MLALAAFALGACAASPRYEPKVELQGFNASRYQADLRDCRKAANLDRYGPVLAGLVVGAGFGAGLGNATGWLATGETGVATGWGAVGGGVIGTGAGLASRPGGDKVKIDQCLRNNGYDILE